ncbi:uncharacterized protein BYT42DRAFT_563423 [Radiomyces spectabilis]|uniref:uncharacterized protein n=1 Tax=Radiomyces spectabilis TaxID=64574 RepID=UPI00221F1B94|nr:uncharacterized protein BYT42DRAFT_563423 [Radiomyces spectabilis]KAI8384712.1 hypothetical protein BYT42DRAFT_563423 [Radiomyces spectabilis]
MDFPLAFAETVINNSDVDSVHTSLLIDEEQFPPLRSSSIGGEWHLVRKQDTTDEFKHHMVPVQEWVRVDYDKSVSTEKPLYAKVAEAAQSIPAPEGRKPVVLPRSSQRKKHTTVSQRYEACMDADYNSELQEELRNIRKSPQYRSRRNRAIKYRQQYRLIQAVSEFIAEPVTLEEVPQETPQSHQNPTKTSMEKYMAFARTFKPRKSTRKPKRSLSKEYFMTFHGLTGR